MYAYPIEGAGEDWESKASRVAADVAESLLPEAYEKRMECRYLLAVPSHIARVAMIGVLRLRYRPRTKKTAAWRAISAQRSMEWARRYEALSLNDEDLQHKRTIING